jgi:transcriptional regulator of nitric oxide reductase
VVNSVSFSSSSRSVAICRRPVLKGGETIGWAFITSDFVGTTGYSGKPIHTSGGRRTGRQGALGVGWSSIPSRSC